MNTVTRMENKAVMRLRDYAATRIGFARWNTRRCSMMLFFAVGAATAWPSSAARFLITTPAG